MQNFKILLTAILIFSGNVFAEPQPEKPVDTETWMLHICKTSSREACAAAYGWHYLRKSQVVIDPALRAMQLSGAVWVVGVAMRTVVGGFPQLDYVITLAAGGVRAGAVLIVGGILVTVVATLVSASSFLFGSTTSTAAPAQDERGGYCSVILEPYKTVDGLEKLKSLTPAQMEELLPCIPQDKDLFGFLKETGRAVENPLH